jgi:hypothetical protein
MFDSGISRIELLKDGTMIVLYENAIPPSEMIKYKILSGNRMLWDAGGFRGAITLNFTVSGNKLVLYDPNNSMDKSVYVRTGMTPKDEQVRKQAKKINKQYQKRLEEEKKQANKKSSEDSGFSLFKNKKSQNKNEYNQFAKADLKNAYAASQSYFKDKPNGLLTSKELSNYGYRASRGVTLNIINGNNYKLRLETKHKEGNITYITDQKGTIIEQKSPADVSTGAKNSDTSKASDLKKVNNESRSNAHGKIIKEEDNTAFIIADFLRKNPNYRTATNKDNLDKDCLQLSKFPYSCKGNLTGNSNRDIVVCFIDSKVKPGKYKDSQGFTRLRGQFVIVVFSIVKGKYQPFIIEKEFPLERGYVHLSKKSLLIQPKCESGPIISYEWKNGKFVKNSVNE